MPYIPKSHEKYNLLQNSRKWDWEVFEYPSFLMEKVNDLIKEDGCHLLPYGYHSYEEYFAEVDRYIERFSENEEIVATLEEFKREMKSLNIKEDWSICRYIGETTDTLLGLINGKCYYWPCLRSDREFRGVIDEEEFTAYLHPTDAEDWEILEVSNEGEPGSRMNKIVIDLEFSPIDKKNKEQRKICRNEIIEIGAVKLDDADRIIDRFDLYVHPVYTKISETVAELTHITDETVSDALEFSDAMDLFLDWVGREEAVMYAWSRNDERQIRSEMSLKKYENSRLTALLNESEDLQHTFTSSLGLERPLSLENAISAGSLTFSGQEHSACDDAYNTAVLYQIMKDEEMFRSFYDAALDLLAPSKSLSFSMGSMFTPEMLAMCAG